MNIQTGTQVTVRHLQGEEAGTILSITPDDGRGAGASALVQFADRTICRFPIAQIKEGSK